MPDANAHPKKHFFIEMFTRDIPLLDCVLDLIDNCVDGLARTGSLKMHTISDDIFSKKGAAAPSRSDRPHIRVKFDGKQFQITDNCGGIDYDYALKDVFNFGHSTKRTKEYLGVYGIGMKRALFKMGRHFVVSSVSSESSFSMHVDVEEWKQQEEEAFEEWKKHN